MKAVSQPVKYQASVKSAHSSTKRKASPRGAVTLRTISKYSDGYIYRPAKDNFTVLKDTFTRDFSSCCYMDFIHPELNFKFNSVDKAFDLFMQYAISESNWNGGKARPTSPGNFQNNLLYKLGHEFATEWMDFINMMSLALSEGTTPHQECMIDKCTKLYDYLENLSSIFCRGTYKSDVCISMIKNLKSEVRSIQKRSEKVIFSDESIIKTRVNVEKLLARIRQLNENISDLYTKTMSKSTLTTGELYRAKTAMNQLCGDILQIVSGAINFINVSQRLQTRIFEMNACVAELFKTIEIPFEMPPALENTENAEAGGEMETEHNHLDDVKDTGEN